MNFLDRLTEVVDECIERDVAPIISWIHHAAEARANETDRQNYIDWWTKVAEKLKDRNYHLSFNLFTELGTDHCAENGEDRKGETCAGSLRRNTMKYNNWTSEVISAICATGENNAERIIILGAPEKTTKGLNNIDLPDPKDRSFLMVEWHEYAAGPTTSDPNRPRHWSGNGSDAQKSQLRDGIDKAKTFTDNTGIPTYFGAWMPRDNTDGGLNEAEVINFARFFVDLLKSAQIPWSLNVLDNYYDTKRAHG